MKLNILPKNDIFFDLFEDISLSLVQISKLLEQSINNPDRSGDIFQEILVQGKSGEKKIKALSNSLQEAFITPFDLEDINELKNILDSIIDSVVSISEMFVLYNVTKTRKPALDLVRELVVSSTILHDSMRHLRKMRIAEFDIEKIKTSERAADNYYKKGVNELFSDKDIQVLDVIKWKDIYEKLEDTVDFCKLAVVTIEGIVLKHA